VAATADSILPSQFRILVDDFAASYRFYRSVLGLPSQDEVQSAGPYACFKFGEGGTDVALFDRAAMTSALGTLAADGTLPARGSAEHAVLAFRVGDVDTAYAKAVADGAPAVSEPADQAGWGMRVAHVRAPEGTVIEFCSWGG
jgi:predicted enzyme related to lactoylglutathione lyase